MSYSKGITFLKYEGVVPQDTLLRRSSATRTTHHSMMRNRICSRQGWCSFTCRQEPIHFVRSSSNPLSRSTWTWRSISVIVDSCSCPSPSRISSSSWWMLIRWFDPQPRRYHKIITIYIGHETRVLLHRSHGVDDGRWDSFPHTAGLNPVGRIESTHRTKTGDEWSFEIGRRLHAE